MDGFEGSHCQTDVDECQSNPCKNNGLCVEQVGTYRCLCKGSYTGTNCEISNDSNASSGSGPLDGSAVKVDDWLIAVMVLAAVILIIVGVLVSCMLYNRRKAGALGKAGNAPFKERANWQMRTGHGTRPPTVLRASPALPEPVSVRQPVYAEYTLEGELFELQSSTSGISNNYSS
ncbi:neurogenic locus protein delta-like [Acanthaster planci]|uniref:Neurogenic locus protein delta-like n=1 Tax=Acanthaster planci TaxID=133434 RepID=A0A8B7ZRE8_ACAPL|nr:neurogenic locus protein delta-like [Acanthaster planci]